MPRYQFSAPVPPAVDTAELHRYQLSLFYRDVPEKRDAEGEITTPGRRQAVLHYVGPGLPESGLDVDVPDNHPAVAGFESALEAHLDGRAGGQVVEGKLLGDRIPTIDGNHTVGGWLNTAMTLQSGYVQ